MKFAHGLPAPGTEREPAKWTSFVAAVQWRGERQRDRPAFVYLTDGEREARRLTYGELDRLARSVAAWIEEHKLVGERVLLLYPDGIDFVTGFLGCLYAGAVAVPAYPPHPRRSDPRLDAIFEDCRPMAAFCVQSAREALSRQLASRELMILATDTLADLSDEWSPRSVDLDSIAHLQYTSGSTGNPKGVMVSHGNLLHQLEYVREISRYGEDTVHVSWQPYFHDMGLVGTLMQPTFGGGLVITMSPAAFGRKPIRWLRAISDYRGTGAAAPNFAYELCVTGTTPEQREGLDLSCWTGAWNGAEPIRAETLDRFIETYEPYGFRRQALMPCYGMAETTLCTTSNRLGRMAVVASFRRDELEQGRVEACPVEHPSAIRLVSSGVMDGGLQVAIVDPETRERCPDDRVGEIWVSGPSIAQGYWQRSVETEETFNARIAGSEEGRFLRTGDLGFLREGDLFVTGRLKDMVIIRGRNVYPQDLELVAQQSHPALQTDACAAFSVDIDGHEALALALEVRRTERRRLDPEEVFEAVRGSIGEYFGVAVHWLGLLEPNRIPKTSSGKIMRRACRQQHLSGNLPLLAEWRSGARKDHDEDEDGVALAATGLIKHLLSLPPSGRRQALVIHLQKEVARALELRAMPDPHKGFERLGIDSMGAVELVNRLQGQLEGTVELPTTLLFDQPSIDAVARYVDGALFGHPDEFVDPGRSDRPLDEPVAVVGLACRFPGANDSEAFWELLDEGRDAIREVPDDRWDISEYFDEDPSAAGKMYTRFGGFMVDIEGFDASFFDISPREAISMDPQHRHLLEVSWLALEHAGIAPATLAGQPVGVFVGISTNDYQQILAEASTSGVDAFSATGNAHSAAVGRLSFALGLEGPCVAVDTACSSSLVALHQAVQSVRQGECETALAGGVNAILSPEVTVAFAKAQLLAPDGRCKTFDAAADGYIRSEGCGMVVLKRLSDAQRDGDRILALIRGSAINQDGRSSGLTAPSGPSQTRVISRALKVSGVAPAEVQYLECHGTGTVLGDPIEVQAANAVYAQGRDPEQPLLIGSVKSNLGHLEAAAGIAGLIKVVLALEHGKIPPSLHYNNPNPHIPWDFLAVKVAGQPVSWEPGSRKRMAGVSSFGFAGSNAHVVLEEAPAQTAEKVAEEDKPNPCLLALSARTEEGLSELAGRYAAWLRQHESADLSDICHTANTGRDHFEHRAVIVGDSRHAIQEQLDALARGKTAKGTELGVALRQEARRVAFLFPGEGLQYSGMARELYEREPEFRACLDRCAEVYDELGREDRSPRLRELMFDPDGMERSGQTGHIRPALYSLQVSLAALWRSWGVLPDALLGHSAGEYAAACVAGVFEVEDGLKLVIERARLMDALPAGGAMLSVTAPAETVEAALAGDESACVSAYNGLNTVISGSADRLDALMEKFGEQELYCQRLPATNAAHSMFVEPILDDFEAYARRIEYTAPSSRLISAMTGEPIGEGDIPDAAYWRAQTRKPVRFAQAVRTLFETVGCDVVLELGPQAELMWLAQMCWRPSNKVLWTSSLAKDRDARVQMLTTAAQLHANGTTLNFAGMKTTGRRHRKLALPSYPFCHQPYWAGLMGGTTRSELQEGLYSIQWEERDPPSSSASRSASQRWVIVADDTQAGEKLASELEAVGQQVVVEPEMDAGDLLEEARSKGPVDHVVLVVCTAVEAGAGADGIRHAQSLGVERALLVAQDLIAARAKTQLWLVTRGIHAVIDAETVDPTHAPVWGFGRTFAIEHPERFGGLVDLPLGTSPSAMAAELAKTLLCDDGECQVALRGERRWVARLRRHPLPGSAPLVPRSDATYLITGGTGALGLHMARHLAERGARHIVLTSRSGARDCAQATMRELADAGCRVEVICADVAVRSEAEGLIEQVEHLADGRSLRGIIHAAGVLDGAPTVTQTPELMAKVMAPKVWGAWNLHDLTVDRKVELDFFVFFSSGAAVLGFPWQGNYSAANAYLDSLAQHRHSRGLPAVSINWGPWSGEGVATRLQALGWEEIGTRLVAPKKAMRLFDLLGNASDPHVCVHPMYWSRWAEQARTGRLPPILCMLMDGLLPLEAAEATPVEAPAHVAPGGEGGPLVRRLSELGPAERRLTLVTHLRERVGAVLGLAPEKIDPEAGFFDLGMNSIMAVELRTILQADLGGALDLQAAVVFNYPTVRKIAEHLAGALFPIEESLPERAPAAPSSAVPDAARELEPGKLPGAIDSVVDEVLGVGAWAPAAGDGDEDTNRRKTLAAILTLRAELHRVQSRATDPIAIVGLSCRYPGSKDPDEFWRMLDEARDGIGEVPAERWNSAAYRDAAPGNANIRFGGFVSDIEYFDAAFFGVSPREAKSLDPQQRMLLEVAWEALENANLAPRRLMGVRGGVFVGIQMSDYAQRVNSQDLEELDAYAGTGNALSASAGRLAFTLGWEGPALAIDTACSSSLVSLHEACASLRAGECDIALAGGVSLILNPMVSLILSRAQMLSPDGRCKTFDASADGFVRGEGCGMVVLKRLTDAQRDRDRVLALVRGSAVNQDGRSSGLTVPNGLAQERVITDALRTADIEPAEVQYLETFGTGTSLGDPIEVQAADAIFSRHRDPDRPLLIGSVKSNIGHTETAAGIAGVIKVTLALQHERIPKNLHFKAPSPHIPWERLNVKVVAESVPWTAGVERRIAGVSSFGFAGTNAHVVLEEAPTEAIPAKSNDLLLRERDVMLLALSARRKDALAELARRYRDWLDQYDGSSLADLCYTANTGRNHFEHRAALVFGTRDELREQLTGIEQGVEVSGTVCGRVAVRGERRVAFLFTGQGSQTTGMGRELYEIEPVFRDHFDQCAALFAELRADAPGLHEIVFEEEDKALLDRTGYTQPALYALEVSLAALWRSWGVEPDAVLGHSVGEYAAACTAGVFSLEDGLRLITERGRLMQRLPSGGAMGSVSAAAEVVEAALRDCNGVCIGAYNGADTVISGAQAGVDALLERFEAEGLRCKRLPTSHAFHSARMDPILHEFRAFAAGVAYHAPNKRLISNVTGEAIPEDRVLDAEYWANHIRHSVQFERGVHALQSLGCDVMLEIGPHPVLAGMGQRCWNAADEALWSASLRRGRSDAEQILSTAAEMYAGGVDLDFAAVDAPWQAFRRKVDLPFYPFQRQRFWVDAEIKRSPTVPSLDRYMYELRWHASEAGSGDGSRFKDRTWLVLGPATGVGSKLADRLTAMGSRVVVAELPDRHELLPEHVAGCLAEAREDPDRPLSGVVHLWSLGDRASDEFSEFQEAQEHGVLSAFTLAQHMLGQSISAELWLVTRGVHRVVDEDGVDPTHAPLWGLGKSIALAHPEMWGGMLDLPTVGNSETRADVIANALRADDHEDHVAFRHDLRWVARLEPMSGRKFDDQIRIDAKAWYLITGGMGAIGLRIAKRLVERGARHLALAGRNAPGGTAKEVICKLEESGCKVEIFQADVSLAPDVSRLFDEMEQRGLPRLAGIFHGAGTTTLASIEELPRDQFVDVMAPKVWGGWLLDREVRVRGLDLDVFFCCSSMASVLGSPHQADYSAANSYLDALMSQRRSEGVAGCSVNFGPWAESGMSAAHDVAELHERLGFRLFSPPVALDAMEAVIASGTGQIALVDLDWTAFKSLADARSPRSLLKNVSSASAEDATGQGNDQVSAELDRIRMASESERLELLTAIVRSEVAGVLRLEPDGLEVDVSWFELGMDSLMAMEVTNRLKRRLGHGALSAELVYMQPTILQLSTALMKTLGSAESYSGEVGEPEPRGIRDKTNDSIEWPASFGQRRVWFLEQMAPASPQFNLPVAVRFEKSPRPELIQRVLSDLVCRHDALRTTLESRNGDLVQIVKTRAMPMLRVVELGEGPDEEERLSQFQEEEARTPFDFTHGFLIRFTLVNFSGQVRALLITMHHAISDGVSKGALLQEFLEIYEAFTNNERFSVPNPQAQFGAYAVYERQQLQKGTVQDDVSFWREELDGIPVLDFPSDHVRPPVQSHEGNCVPIALSADIRNAVRECSKHARVTPFITLLAAWSLLLSRYSGQRDFGIGTPVAGRDGPQWEGVIGFFVNMLVLRVKLDHDWTVQELLAHVEAVTKRAYGHQTLPFDWLVEQLNPARDPSRTPLFQTSLIFEVPTHDLLARVDGAGLSLTDMRPALRSAQFDITLDLLETNTGFKGFIEYNTDLFDRWRIEQMAEHYEILLSALTKRPESPIATLPLLNADEYQRLLTAWNRTDRNFSLDRCVHECVAEQARRNPKKIAVVCGEERLTYRQLNRQANRLAHYLQSRGVGPEKLVGLCLDRSLDMVVGMLGVMKAGGTYVPLDSDFPKQRLDHMLNDANLTVLASQTALMNRLPKLDVPVVCMDRDGDRIAMESIRNPENRAESGNPAYVIYTSGSTGKPKGVVITHRSLINFLMAMTEEIEFSPRDVMIAVTTLSFDISNLEILLPLMQGACTVIATNEETRDAHLLRQVLAKNSVSIMQATPATWRMLLESGWTNPERIRALCGGEALHQDLAEGLLEVTDSLWNVYGPTETTIWSMIHRVREADRPTVTLGRPLANTQIHILDDYLQPVPIGVPGELFIGGDGLAREYLNQPELTAERFIRNPFSEQSDARLYRTGDLCRRLPDGDVEFLGRRDQQVKVRGFRIETGDVEAALIACPGVREAVVTTRKGTDGFDYLAGYLVADDGHCLEIRDIKASLREKLPEYMVPGMLMLLEEFPLTPNNKVDRRALPSPELAREQVQKDFVAPRTEAEMALTEAWKKVLNVERVGIRDNFFELGGHSLLIVQIVSALKESYDTDVSVAELYHHETVEALAAYLERRAGGSDHGTAESAREIASLGLDSSGRQGAISNASRAVDSSHSTQHSPSGTRDIHHRIKDGPAYTYRRYRPGDKKAAIASFAEAFGHKTAMNADKTFDWKYMENPLAPVDGPIVDVLECDGKIVGMNGGVCARFKIKEESISGIWGCDTHVVPEHRKASAWFSYQVNENAPAITLGMPNAKNYSILSAAKAVTDIARFTELKACLDMGSVLKARGLNPFLSSLCGLLFSPTPKAVGLFSRLRAEKSVYVRKISRIDKRFDELWQAASQDYSGIMVRDQTFLSWRFDRCPNRDYTKYAAERNGEIVGYMVTRDTQWKGFGRGRIVDYLVRRDDSAALNSLLKRAIGDFRSRGVVSVTCSVVTNERKQISQLRQHGFFYRRPGPHIVASRGPLQKSFANIKNWFFTYADGDIDYCDFEGEDVGKS